MTQAPEDTRAELETQVQDDIPTESDVTPPQPSSDETPRPASTPQPQDGLAERIAEMDRATAQRQNDLQRQLARLEGRFDRGGDDGAALREVRKQILALQATAAGITDLKESMSQMEELREAASRLEELDDLKEGLNLLLRRNLDAEEYAAIERRQAEKRLLAERKRSEERASRERKKLEDRASKAERQLADTLSTVQPPPTQARQPSATPPPTPPGVDLETERAAGIMYRRIRAAEYDPDDPAVQQRLLAAAGDVSRLATPFDRLEAITDALARIQAEDRRNAADAARKAAEAAAKKETEKAEAERRTAARAAVQPDRTRAQAPSAKSFTTQRELEAAFATDQVDAETFRRLINTLPR